MKKLKLLLPLVGLLGGLALAAPSIRADVKTSADVPEDLIYAKDLDGYLTMFSYVPVVSDPSVIKVSKDTSFTVINLLYSFKVESKEAFDSAVTCILNTNSIEEKNIRVLKIKDNTYSALNFKYANNQATFAINEPGLFGLVDLSNSTGKTSDPAWLPIVAITVAVIGIGTAVFSLVLGVKKHEKQK